MGDQGPEFSGVWKSLNFVSSMKEATGSKQAKFAYLEVSLSS